MKVQANWSSFLISEIVNESHSTSGSGPTPYFPIRLDMQLSLRKRRKTQEKKEKVFEELLASYLS